MLVRSKTGDLYVLSVSTVGNGLVPAGVSHGLSGGRAALWDMRIGGNAPIALRGEGGFPSYHYIPPGGQRFRPRSKSQYDPGGLASSF